MTADHPAARAAADELRTIRSTDPCASLAIATIKATILTLETRWLRSGPAVDDDRSGDA